MPPRAEGAASRGGKMTARATPGGKTPKARSPRQRSPAAEGKSRTSSDKKQKSKHESGSSAGRNSSGGRGSGGSGHREMGGGGSSGSGRRGMSQDDSTPGQPDASGLHLVISLDFGNGGTGYAYEYKGPEGGLYTKVFALGEPDNLTSTKAPTCLLLDTHHKFVAFGERARNQATQDSTKDLDKFNLEFMYFEGFKMELKDMKPHEVPTVQPTMGLPKDVRLSTLLQVIFEQTALEVYRHVKAHSRKPISTVTWVVTHPVDWPTAARKLMEIAAEKGGLLTPTNDMVIAAKEAGLGVPVINPILLLSEPEAAMLHATQNDPVEIGDIIMVVDNGAGTTDISTHEIVAVQPITRSKASGPIPHYFQESLLAQGGPWGSNWIDKALAEQVLEQIFDEVELKQISPCNYNKLIQEFQIVKHTYGGSGPFLNTIKIGDILIEITEGSPKDLIEEIKKRIKDKGIRIHFSNFSNLVLEDALIEDLFKPVTLEIVKTIKDRLTRAAEDGELPGRIILAGGFSESPYLKKKIEEAIHWKTLFPGKPEYSIDNRLILAADPRLAVLKGGVLHGLHHGEFRFVRIARFTYGFDFDQKIDDLDGVNYDQKIENFKKKHEIHDFPENSISPCKKYILDLFQVLLKKGDLMSKDQRAGTRHQFEALKKGNSFSIFESDDLKPVFTSGGTVRKLGTILLASEKKDIIKIHISFGGDKITAIARNQTQNVTKQEKFEYEFEKQFDLDVA